MIFTLPALLTNSWYSSVVIVVIGRECPQANRTSLLGNASATRWTPHPCRHINFVCLCNIADPVRRVQILEVTKVRSTAEKEEREANRRRIQEEDTQRREARRVQATAQLQEAQIKRMETCRDFLKAALSRGPIRRRDVRRMAQGQIPLPDGSRLSATNSFSNARLEASADDLKIVRAMNGNGGLMWSLPEKEKAAHA